MEKGGTIKHDSKNAPKTGDWRFMKPEVDASKCIGCGTCVEHCPEAVINLEPGTQNAKRKIQKKDGSTFHVTRYATIDFEYCKGCGVCATICPVKAISMRK